MNGYQGSSDMDQDLWKLKASNRKNRLKQTIKELGKKQIKPIAEVHTHTHATDFREIHELS
jgi:hypothetical protein